MLVIIALYLVQNHLLPSLHMDEKQVLFLTKNINLQCLSKFCNYQADMQFKSKSKYYIVKLGSCSSLLKTLNSTLNNSIQKQKEQSWRYNPNAPTIYPAVPCIYPAVPSTPQLLKAQNSDSTFKDSIQK